MSKNPEMVEELGNAWDREKGQRGNGGGTAQQSDELGRAMEVKRAIY